MNHWLLPIRSPPISDSNRNRISCPTDHGLESKLDTQQLVRSVMAGQQQPQLEQLGQAASSQSTCTAFSTSKLGDHSTELSSGQGVLRHQRSAWQEVFYRNIQSTPWSSKSGLAGKDVGQLKVVDLTRKGLDDYADFSHFEAGYSQPSSLLYAGSTAVGVAKRQLNRMAVYRRLKTTEFVDAELLLRYWASHDNLFDFVIVPLMSCADYQAAWAFEHELIAQRQTQLNYSISEEDRLRVSSLQETSLICLCDLWPLWRKLRKRLHGQCKQSTIKGCRQLAWNILYDLGSHTRASFEAARTVRSKRMSD